MSDFPPLPAIDRFERLHGVADAVVRLFGTGDWTLERGRGVDASLRALLLAWTAGRPAEDDEAIAALLASLEAADLFDPAIIVDRGPFVQRLLSLRDRVLLEAASAQPDWRPGAWETTPTGAGAHVDGDAPTDADAWTDGGAPTDADGPTDSDQRDPERRFAGLLSRAFTRLYQASLALDDHTIVSVADRRGIIVEVNEAFCRISGYERGELLGAAHSIVKSGRHSQAFYRELWSTITAGRIWNGEICNRRKDGSYYWVRSTIIPVLDAAGKPDEYVSVRTEITAEKWADERLALLEHAIVACSSAVVIADALRPELPIAYANPSCERLLARKGGGSRGELRGASLHELLGRGQPADAFDALDALLGSADGGSILLRGTRADGSPWTFDLRLSPVLHSNVRTHVVAVISDVTELETTRAELHDRDERLRRIAQCGSFGTWDSEIATRRLRWCEGTAAILGLPAHETGTNHEHFLAGVHPHDRQRVVDAAHQCLKRDKPYDLEHRCLRPDGSVRWVHARGRVIRDDRGRPVRMLGVVQDVSECKRLSAALRHERRRLVRTQALARLGEWRIDHAAGVTCWSASLYDVYRRDPSSFRPHAGAFADAADPRDVALIAAALQAARDGQDADCVHRISLPDGRRRWVRLRAQPERDALGGIVGVAGTAQDVTDTLRGEDCARLLRRVVAMSEDAIAIADRYGELVHANAAWRRMLGHEPGHRPQGALLAACEAAAREVLEREIQRRDPGFRHRGDLTMRRLDGTSFVARGEIAVVHDARGDVQFFAHRFRDAGRALAYERSLGQARAQLEQAREAACRYMGRTSEALHGPSQAVLAFARLLATRPELSDVARQYLRYLADAGRRTLRVVGDRLDLARAEAGRLSLCIEPFALDEAFDELREPGIDDVPVVARASIAGNERLVVLGDRMRLVQVLRALLTDAPGAHLSAARTGAPCGEQDDAIAIRVVRDDAAAAPHEARVLARRLLGRMGATIEEECAQQTDGSRERADAARAQAFVLRLRSAPCEAVAQACDDAALRGREPPAGTTAAGPARAGPRQRTVLHVDDDLAGLSLLQEAFRDDSRLRIRVSPSALLGIELAQSRSPDVVLLDVDSRAVDAFAMLRRLRVDPRTRDIPVVAITADVSGPNRRRIDACGFFRFVEKPLSLPELLRTIDAACVATRRAR